MSARSEGGHGRQEWNDWIDRARGTDLLAIAESLGASLKKVAANEFAGPCPLCGGHDRFSVNTRKRVFNCRGSGDGGDVIAMVQHLGDYDFLGACERINDEPRPDHSRDETPGERELRLRSNAARMAVLEHRRKEERKAEEARAKRDEEAVADILERAKPIEGTHAEAYMREGRGLIPPKRFTQDLRFVADLDYRDAGDNGTGQLTKLATLPALIAIIHDCFGAVIGFQATYLDPDEPRNCRPIGSPHNSAKRSEAISAAG
jgi:CHC2 zinc finger